MRQLSARRRESEATKHRPIDSRSSDQPTAEQALGRIEGEGSGVPEGSAMYLEIGPEEGSSGRRRLT